MWQNQWTAPSEWMVQEGFWQKRMSHENIREEIAFWTEKRAGEEDPKGGKNGLRMITEQTAGEHGWSVWVRGRDKVREVVRGRDFRAP